MRIHKISNLTGVNDPYETPSHPELLIDTSQLDIETATELFCRFISGTCQHRNPFCLQLSIISETSIQVVRCLIHLLFSNKKFSR